MAHRSWLILRVKSKKSRAVGVGGSISLLFSEIRAGDLQTLISIASSLTSDETASQFQRFQHCSFFQRFL